MYWLGLKWEPPNSCQYKYFRMLLPLLHRVVWQANVDNNENGTLAHMHLSRFKQSFLLCIVHSFVFLHHVTLIEFVLLRQKVFCHISRDFFRLFECFWRHKNSLTQLHVCTQIARKNREMFILVFCMFGTSLPPVDKCLRSEWW